jgi:hypothetical protein
VREFGSKEVEMNERRSNLKIVGMILLGLFAVVVGVPLLLVAFGAVALTSLFIFAKLVALAIFAIKLAVTIAIIYLIVVGIRAFLK